MKKTYCRWSDEEIKQLFNFIGKQTNENKTRAQAFSLYAQSSNRKPNSVRNYYYLELEYLKNNPEIAKKLGISLKLHQKQTPNYFSQKEAEQCMKDIKLLVKEGNSVRKACLILSNGNIEKMVRLQNKYRSLEKASKQKLQEKHNSTVFASNIISMPQRKNLLTEQEINSLFLGLLKLIKASAKQESLANLNKKTEDANHQLRKTIVVLNEKERQLKKLRESFALLKQENTKAKETINILRAETASLLASSNQKMHALKKYAGDLKQTSPKTKSRST